MNGKLFAGLVLMLVLGFACLLSAPVFGEHPWDADAPIDGSDPGSGDNPPPGNVDTTDTIDSLEIKSMSGDSGDSSVPPWCSFLMQVFTTAGFSL